MNHRLLILLLVLSTSCGGAASSDTTPLGGFHTSPAFLISTYREAGMYCDPGTISDSYLYFLGHTDIVYSLDISDSFLYLHSVANGCEKTQVSFFDNLTTDAVIAREGPTTCQGTCSSDFCTPSAGSGSERQYHYRWQALPGYTESLYLTMPQQQSECFTGSASLVHVWYKNSR